MQLMTREWLTVLRKKAWRRRVWYRVLSHMERSILDLTIRCVDRVRSTMLARVISRIVCKIAKACQSGFHVRVWTLGYRLAERRSRIAVSWGYTQASTWMTDPTYIKSLGINGVNNLSGWTA